ncbi:hypothetical protein V494_02921 [Pseudogymnoascus sp. VKM F-4513 (FW-928)]|nr:hypothetical protein V494_02921 [Pseudogymnoascus sp. VKM F-4513 (FW-928)]
MTPLIHQSRPPHHGLLPRKAKSYGRLQLLVRVEKVDLSPDYKELIGTVAIANLATGSLSQLAASPLPPRVIFVSLIGELKLLDTEMPSSGTYVA